MVCLKGSFGGSLLASALYFSSTTSALDLNVNNVGSIKQAASALAQKTLSAFSIGGNGIPTAALGSTTYYFWELGAMWGALVDYTAYTGDKQYVQEISDGLLYQVGPNYDFMPPNQTKTEGNDDQAFWGWAVMSAAESNLQAPSGGAPSWSQLATTVFDEQAARWDTATCNGGLRWQIFTFNAGYDYKNSASNAAFFLLASRLARYTSNSTFADWATKAYDWSSSTGLIASNYYVYDGTSTTSNCSTLNRIQWSYTTGMYMYGAAAMYNHTGQQVWLDRVQGLLNASSIFLANGSNVLFEPACEPGGTCDVDARAFKGVTAQCLGKVKTLVPSVASSINPILLASAGGAAQACPDAASCGAKWYVSGSDGTTGAGEELSALQVVQSLLATSPAVSPSSFSSNTTSSTNGTNSTSGGSGGASGSNGTTTTTRNAASAMRPNQGVIVALSLTMLFSGVFWAAL